MHVVMYSREGCHLCDVARDVLMAQRARTDFGFEEISIDGDDRLELEYGIRVPVVEIDGRAVFEVEVDPEELVRLIQAERDHPPAEVVDPTPARAPVRGSLEGRSVMLRPLDPELDAAPLWRASADGTEEAVRMWDYMPYGPFADESDMRAWMEPLVDSDDPLFFTVVGSDGPVGMTSFLNVDVQMRRLELGHIWFVPAAQRSEANTESAYLMLRESFDRLGHRRVEWKCDARNQRSRAAAIRLGFTFEGVFRQHMIVKGRNRDTAWYSMLDGEWPAARAALESWLERPPGDRPPLASIRASLR